MLEPLSEALLIQQHVESIKYSDATECDMTRYIKYAEGFALLTSFKNYCSTGSFFIFFEKGRPRPLHHHDAHSQIY